LGDREVYTDTGKRVLLALPYHGTVLHDLQQLTVYGVCLVRVSVSGPPPCPQQGATVSHSTGTNKCNTVSHTNFSHCCDKANVGGVNLSGGLFVYADNQAVVCPPQVDRYPHMHD